MSFTAHDQHVLRGCHHDLRRLMHLVEEHFPIEIIEGHRPKERQDEMFAAGKSTLRWPLSKHNKEPSLAVDAGPKPIRWPSPPPPASASVAEVITWMKKWGRWYYWGGFVLGVAAIVDIPVRWGGDWDNDREVDDQSFNDLPHIELAL